MKYFSLFFAPAMGAVIGYFTNWLAIKMLFKPHNEIKFLGMKLPFTPGLIPKERYRISEQIGSAVGNDLLTDKAMLNTLTSNETTNKLSIYIEKELKNSLSNYKTYNELLDELLKDKKSTMITSLSHSITNAVYKYLVNDHTKEYIFTFIYDQTKSFLTKSESLKEIMDDSLITETQKLALYHTPNIIAYLNNLLNNDSLSARIKELLNEIIGEKFGAFGAMLVNVDSIYETAKEKIHSELENEDNVTAITNEINKIIDEALNKSLNDFVPADTMDEICKVISQSTTNIIYNEISKNKLQPIVDQIIINYLNTKLEIDDTYIEHIKILILDKYSNILNENFQDIVSFLDIPKIIEDEINSYDINKMESMILSIVKKELSAITWFGALLGFIMGILIPIFS